MSHLTTISVTLGLGAVLLGGCASHGPVVDAQASTQPQIMIELQPDDTIALAAVHQSLTAGDHEPNVFHLGAGDALGRAVFVTYVASLREARDDMRFATGADDRPE